MKEHVYPNEKALFERANSPERWTIHPLVEQLKEEAKKQGLWNLFMPVDTDKEGRIGKVRGQRLE